MNKFRKITSSVCLILALVLTMPLPAIADTTFTPEMDLEAWEDTTTENNSAVPLYFQTDYPHKRYGDGTVATSGCGITSLAMVASYMTGYDYLPDELADSFGGRAENNIARLEYASDIMQLPWHKAENFHKILDALREGNLAILMLDQESIFTDSQHFIVLTGISEEGRIFVNDPFGPNYENWQLKNGFENGFEENDLLLGYSGGWIYEVDNMPEIPFIYYAGKTEDIESRYTDIQLTLEEEELLAKVIWVESRGESAEGQQAVAEIVFNRMVSENFPDLLKEVIYGEGQFRSVPFLEDATPWQAQYDAIENAISGPNVLPMDVMYFATYPTNDNVWGKIGGHIFCYE